MLTTVKYGNVKLVSIKIRNIVPAEEVCPL